MQPKKKSRADLFQMRCNAMKRIFMWFVGCYFCCCRILSLENWNEIVIKETKCTEELYLEDAHLRCSDVLKNRFRLI